MRPSKTVTKLEAANRQLCTAIRMFFADKDAIAVHTLACAAREILEQRCKKAGHRSLFEYFRLAHPQLSEKEIRARFNKARNFFKHDGREGDDAIEFDDFSNDPMLFVGSNDCAKLMGRDQPNEVDVFYAWFSYIYLPDMYPQPDILEILKSKYGDFRQVNRVEQKKVGAKMLIDFETVLEKTERSRNGDATHS